MSTVIWIKKILHGNEIKQYLENYKSKLVLKWWAAELAISLLSLSLRSSWQQTDEYSRKLDNIYFWKLIPKQVLFESFKFFDPPTTKWWSFKAFAKFNGNHISIANFFKLCKYQTFFKIKLHNLSKG